MISWIALLILFPLTTLNSEGEFNSEELKERDFITYSFKQNSWLSLSGTTNVNTFECLSSGDIANGYIVVDGVAESDRLSFTQAGIVLDINSFDCKNQLITRDMKKALGGNDFAGIELQLLDAKTGVLDLDKKSGNILTNIEITINEISIKKEISIAWSRTGAFEYHFEGTANLSLVDFKIDPPSPALGLVKVNDGITVNFNFNVMTAAISRLD